jgi:hypothetical protein
LAQERGPQPQRGHGVGSRGAVAVAEAGGGGTPRPGEGRTTEAALLLRIPEAISQACSAVLMLQVDGATAGELIGEVEMDLARKNRLTRPAAVHCELSAWDPRVRSTLRDSPHNGVGSSVRASEHGTRSSSREAAARPSPDGVRVVSAKTSACRWFTDARCTCPNAKVSR